tara:strand:+ start:187 stop:810 length:624 start_codon:yes stop_codon:yes gene_type:complete
MLPNLKKGAMFGLDARIALAIFGALSVISGAALFSAIKQTKAITTLTQFKELEKAWESYLLDTGSYLPRRGTSDSSSAYREIKTKELVENNGVQGWNGPYIDLTPNSSSWQSLKCPQSETSTSCRLNIKETQDGSFTTNCRSYMSKCNLWIEKSTFFATNKDLDDAELEILDARVDNSDGATSGKIQWDKANYNIYYKIASYPPGKF